MTVFAEKALLAEGWRENVRIEFDGRLIGSITADATRQAGDERHAIIVPGMPNLHSHAFQRAMAGLAEVRGPASDSFWSWRTVMYDFALSMTPEEIEAVAAQLYMEMLEAGFTRVGEFHYLHHQKGGRPYANIAEHAERIGAASAAAGINLTLLPVFYAHSNFGGQPPIDGQRRFINSLDSFAGLMEASDRVTRGLEGGELGLALHSLRAVTPDELNALMASHGNGPIHIHVAEQVKEVDDCIAWSGARPVEWLLANAPVDQRWCFIHATHMTEAETAEMAMRGAIAGLCPITEANLGDGIFPAETFLKNRGQFGIGSDSNISISVAHELRQLEYSERLGLRARNVVAEAGQSTGRRLFDGALAGGAKALSGGAVLSAGAPADFVSLDAEDVFVRSDDQLLDHWIFADGVKVGDVWANGRKCVESGRHIARERIVEQFRKTMKNLVNG
jgi:formimidoylglutamate deiminase